MEPSYKENYFRFVISIPMLFDLVESFRRAEESLELEVGYNRVGDEVVAGRSLGLEEERCDVEVMQGKDINEPDKVKQELEDVMEVEVADPLGMDLEESPQFSNNANNENSANNFLFKITPFLRIVQHGVCRHCLDRCCCCLACYSSY